MAGNANSGKRKDKLFRDALMIEFKEVEAVDPSAPRSMRSIARKLISLAEEGDIQAIKEIGDRMDGKPAQALIGGDDDDPAIKVAATIERIITDPANPDSAGIQATTPTEPV